MKIAICLYIVLGILIGAWTSSKGLCSPYSIFSSFIALAFYALGNLLRTIILKLTMLKNRNCYLIVLSILSLLIESILCVKTNHNIRMASNEFIFSDLFLALLGILAIFSISKFIESIFRGRIRRTFIWLGQNTLVIMCSHMLMISLSAEIIRPIIPNHLLYKTVESLFVWSMVVLLSIFVNNKCKWLIGKN